MGQPNQPFLFCLLIIKIIHGYKRNYGGNTTRKNIVIRMPKDQDSHGEIDTSALQRLEALQRQTMIDLFDFDPEERSVTKQKRSKPDIAQCSKPDITEAVSKKAKKSRTDLSSHASIANESKTDPSSSKTNSILNLPDEDSISFTGTIFTHFGLLYYLTLCVFPC